MGTQVSQLTVRLLSGLDDIKALLKYPPMVSHVAQQNSRLFMHRDFMPGNLPDVLPSRRG